MAPEQAVRENDMTTVKKLLSAGVDVDCLFYNWTPLMLGELEMFIFFKLHILLVLLNKELTILSFFSHLAINKNNEELALMLVRRGASVTYRDELGNAPLHEAVRKNMIEVVKVL